ncbi:MAG: hypothetical protein ACK5V2_14930, partial [Pseudomonadota bacterium]
MQNNGYTADADVRSGWLPLDERHTMYFEESGNPRGRPVVYLHGGRASHGRIGVEDPVAKALEVAVRFPRCQRTDRLLPYVRVEVAQAT